MPLHPKAASKTTIKKSPGVTNVKKVKRVVDANKEETGEKQDVPGKRKHSTNSISDGTKQGNKEKIPTEGKRHNSADDIQQQQQQHVPATGIAVDPGTGVGTGTGIGTGAGTGTATAKKPKEPKTSTTDSKREHAAVASASKKWKSMVGKPSGKHLGKRKSGTSVNSKLKKSRSKSAISVLDPQHRHSHHTLHPHPHGHPHPHPHPHPHRISADSGSIDVPIVPIDPVDGEDTWFGVNNLPPLPPPDVDDDDEDATLNPQEEAKDETGISPTEDGPGVTFSSNTNPNADVVEETEAPSGKKPLGKQKSRVAARKKPKTKRIKKKKSRLKPCCCGQFQFRSCCILMVVAHILVWFFVWIFYLLAQSETVDAIDDTTHLSFVGIVLIGVNTGMSLFAGLVLTIGILCRKMIPCLMHFGTAIVNSVFTLVLAVVIGLVLRKKQAECISLSLFCAFSAIVFAYAAYCSFGLAKLVKEGKDKIDEVEPTYIDDSPTDEEDFLPAYTKN